jgi:antitoxin component of MazEF toxin-antitoxin module
MEYLRTTKIIKTGTSLCVVIPKEILAALNMQRGDQISFGIADENTIFLHRITQQEILQINLASAGATANIK